MKNLDDLVNIKKIDGNLIERLSLNFALGISMSTFVAAPLSYSYGDENSFVYVSVGGLSLSLASLFTGIVAKAYNYKYKRK